MKIKKLLVASMLMLLLYSCQSETPQLKEQPTRSFIVRASFPDTDETRAQITYGNPNKDEEIFMWDEQDEIFLYNITQFEEYPEEASCILQYKKGNSAIFKFIPSDSGHAKTFGVKKGDTILAIYGETIRRCLQDENGNDIYDKDSQQWLYDERNIVTIGVGTEGNKPQILVTNPDNASLEYMKDNLKMYDIVQAAEDDSIPDLHFKHLSAIMRVTLHNASGKDLYPTKLEFNYPDTEAFFNTTMYCSVIGNSPEDYGLEIYDTNEFFNGSKPYTSSIGTTINGKDGTTDIGEKIPNGETYELYLSTVPRIDKEPTGTELTINLIVSHDTDNPYSGTINGFNVPIKGGSRYWFKMTATPDGKLVRSSQWNPTQN